jgi:transglutaminase/protease-like cytokinesis protein 3
MKIPCVLVLLLLIERPFCQTKPVDYDRIDRKVIHIHGAHIDSLAKQLIQLGTTDHEKVRAIFRWITEHISYNTIVFNRSKKPAPGRITYDEPDDTAATLPPLDKRVAACVLRRKFAICEGYSRLFKTLCDEAGIRNEIISGYARTNTYKKQPRFGVNHMWNAVYLDSSWHLLDVTWASGFISYSNEYVKEYNDRYFLTRPEDFIRDHYPEDLQWTLLADPPTYGEFSTSPFKYSAFVKAGIGSYLPAKGIIDIKPGDSIQIRLQTSKETKNFGIAETSTAGSNQICFPDYKINGDVLSFNYKISANTGQWLYIYYDDEPVMRYNIRLKKVENDLAGFSPK